MLLRMAFEPIVKSSLMSFSRSNRPFEVSITYFLSSVTLLTIAPFALIVIFLTSGHLATVGASSSAVNASPARSNPSSCKNMSISVIHGTKFSPLYRDSFAILNTTLSDILMMLSISSSLASSSLRFSSIRSSLITSSGTLSPASSLSSSITTPRGLSISGSCSSPDIRCAHSEQSC